MESDGARLYVGQQLDVFIDAPTSVDSGSLSIQAMSSRQ
jgi:hypothetical protein